MDGKRPAAILVIGPESSGTRFLTRLLCAAGYFGGWEHRQALDYGLPAADRPIVWRRSVPHGPYWYSLPEWVEKVRAAGWEPYVVVTTRDPYCMARSQVAQTHTEDFAESLEHIRRAYLHIFSGLAECGVPFAVASYESLAFHPEAVSGIMAVLGLPPVPTTAPDLVKYANTKWYNKEGAA